MSCEPAAIVRMTHDPETRAYVENDSQKAKQAEKSAASSNAT